MRSSSTASITLPRALADSSSRMRAARSICAVASRSDAVSSRDSWCSMNANSPAPRSASVTRSVAVYQAVSRRRSAVSGSAARIVAMLRAETVAGAANGVHELGLEAVVELPPDAAHEHLEDVGERVGVVV